MKFGENSPEQDPLTKVADRRCEEYFTKERAEKLARLEEVLNALRIKLELKPEESFRDFFRLSPSKNFVDTKPATEINPEIGSAVEDLFEKIYRIYAEGADWDKTFKKDPRNG
jgi:hypothetical protein